MFCTHSIDSWVDVRVDLSFLSSVFNLARALPDFLTTFGILSVLMVIGTDSESTLLAMDAAWLRMKLVDCSRTEVDACEDDESHLFLIPGRSIEVISLCLSIPSSDQIILCLLFSNLGAEIF